MRVELVDATLAEEHVRSSLRHHRCRDLADHAVLRRDAAVREDDRVAHGKTAARGDDDLVGCRGLLTLAQLEAGQRSGGPRVRLDQDGTAGTGIRTGILQ